MEWKAWGSRTIISGSFVTLNFFLTCMRPSSSRDSADSKMAKRPVLLDRWIHGMGMTDSFETVAYENFVKGRQTGVSGKGAEVCDMLYRKKWKIMWGEMGMAAGGKL